jgi:D-alanyl-lipoteichoic acid acyltransferase DltB (MBOAT superfamily)
MIVLCHNLAADNATVAGDHLMKGITLVQVIQYAVATILALAAAYWLYTKRAKGARYVAFAVVAVLVAMYTLCSALISALHSPACWFVAILAFCGYRMYRKRSKHDTQEQAVKP